MYWGISKILYARRGSECFGILIFVLRHHTLSSPWSLWKEILVFANFLFLFPCVCVLYGHVNVPCVYMCLHVFLEARVSCWVSSCLSTLVFETRSPTGLPASPKVLPSLIPSPGITGTGYGSGFFRSWESELRSSRVCGRHTTNWPFSQPSSSGTYSCARAVKE